jgi:hypothetical protein
VSAERGWIGDPQPTAERRKHSVETWAERHRREGHHPYPAPTKENPERWECKCDPEWVGFSVWRILTERQEREKWRKMMGAVGDGGYQTREAQEAHRRYAEEGTWRATQHPPSSVQ